MTGATASSTEASVGIVAAVENCLGGGYVDLAGRAPRAEYWWFSVVYVAGAALAGALALGLGSWWWMLLVLPLVPPMLSVSVRRLHDTGRSGWWMLVALVPVVGPVVYLYLMTLPTSAQHRDPDPTVR